MAPPFGIEVLNGTTPIVRAIAIPLVIFFLLSPLLNIVKEALLRKARTKKQITNIQLFHKLSKYVLILIVVWIAFLSYAGSLAGLGLSIGFFAVIVAWTFMRPILGVLAWFTIVIKRPFGIGDRIRIENIKGDVEDITLTHIYIRETGGLVRGSEDTAGSLVTIPNAFFFEYPVVNYTDRENYVLQEVTFRVTYESYFEKAAKIAQRVSEQVLNKEIPDYDKKPFVRTLFEDGGIGMHVRYYAPAKDYAKIADKVTYGILKELRKTKKVKLVTKK